MRLRRKGRILYLDEGDLLNIAQGDEVYAYPHA